MKKYLMLLAILALILSSSPAFSMTITPMDSATNMAQSLVGSGVTISNVSYTGADAASGYFSGGTAAGIGIESGVVLTSGFASNLNGTTNTSDGITGNNGVPGSSILNALIPGYSTHDATLLSFDFQIAGTAGTTGALYFNYVFGSDEYDEYVGSSFNDVFGFFVDGTDVSDNIALIPGTSTPVAINNVNNGSNSTYYNDNDPSNGTPTPYPFEYDGFTDVLQASITGLSVGTPHTLTLAIADAGDYILDSGVFLEAESISNEPTTPPTDVPEPTTMLLLGAGLLGLVGFSKKKFKKS